MRVAAILGMAAVAAGAWAADDGGTEPRSATVCISTGPAFVVARGAQLTASEIFDRVGIGIHWHTAPACPHSPDAIRISIVSQASPLVSENALAMALPYEGTHIMVFYERVKAQCNCEQLLLAFVLVHEITHILQGVGRHSATGIMKAHWTYEDYFKMRRGKLGFAAEDVVLIQKGMNVRALRFSGKGGDVPLMAAR